MRKPLGMLFDIVREQRKQSDRYAERKIIYLESDRITHINKLRYQENGGRPYLLAEGYIDVKDKLADFLKDFTEEDL